jgi:hypothetical protein
MHVILNIRIPRYILKNWRQKPYPYSEFLLNSRSSRWDCFDKRIARLGPRLEGRESGRQRKPHIIVSVRNGDANVPILEDICAKAIRLSAWG